MTGKPGSTVHSGRALCALLLAMCLSLSACTIAKPIVCTFTWPVVFLTEGFRGAPLFNGSEGEGLGDHTPYFLGAVFAVGPVGGLVTGFISDVNVLMGWSRTGKPGHNIHHPLLTNGKGSK